jgi:hypothetical protein
MVRDREPHGTIRATWHWFWTAFLAGWWAGPCSGASQVGCRWLPFALLGIRTRRPAGCDSYLIEPPCRTHIRTTRNIWSLMVRQSQAVDTLNRYNWHAKWPTNTLSGAVTKLLLQRERQSSYFQPGPSQTMSECAACGSPLREPDDVRCYASTAHVHCGRSPTKKEKSCASCLP